MAVYIAKGVDESLVKIGFSNMPERRCRELGIAPLRILNGNHAVEYYLHDRFGSARTEGEWFKFDPLMLTCRIPAYVKTKDKKYATSRALAPRGHLDLAIARAGGVTALAEKIGVTKQAVQQWPRCPAGKVLLVEKLTGISRHDLRPDIFGKRAA